MRYIVTLSILLLSFHLSFTQNIFSLTADTVRISGVNDSAELIIKNRTRNMPGVLFNKGNGITEFRALKFLRIGDSTLLILGTDTTPVKAGIGSGGAVYMGDPDVLLSAARQDATSMRLRWWKSNSDLYESARIGVIGDSQGKGDYASSYSNSIIGRLQQFIYSVVNNPSLTNYCQNGYNSRRLLPTGSNSYVDNQHNITKALADGNKIIILCNTSNDFSSNGAGGVTSVAEAMTNTLQIADACAKAGATLFVVSSFPRTELPAAQWDSLRVMADMLHQKFAARCAFVYHLLEDPSQPKQLNPALQVNDNIHLNDAGCNIVYSAIRDMLTSYFVSNTNVARYELQKARLYNGNYNLAQYVTLSNSPNVTLPADSNFYRVRVVYHDGYFSKWSNIVQGTLASQETQPDQPPLLTVNTPQILFLPNNSVTLTASASDPNTDGVITTYKWFKLSGNVATINSPNAATTTVTGLVEGSYIFRCQVTNNRDMSTFADALVTILVPNEDNTTSKFNFNVSPQNIPGWVDVSGGPLNSNNNGASWTENANHVTLVNISNSTSVWGPDYYSNASNNNGHPTADGGGYPIPQAVINSSWYSYNMPYVNSSSDQMKITGLNPAKLYKLKFYCSINASYNLNANPTVVVVNDNLYNQKQVNPIGNTSNVLIFRGIAPDVNGVVRFFVGGLQGVSQFGMLNGLSVQIDNLDGSPVAPTVTSSGDKTVQLPNSTTALTVAAADPNGALTAIAWTQLSGPAGPAATIADPGSLSTTVSGLSAGTYVFRCTITNNYGLSGSADVQVLVKPGTTNPVLYVGGSLNPYTLSNWTVLAGSPGQNVLSATGALMAAGAGVVANVNISTVGTDSWTPFSSYFTAANTGETIDDGGGFAAPGVVTQGNFFNENTYNPAKPQFRISGLPAGTYKVTIFGSVQASFTGPRNINATTEFRVNGGSPVLVNTAGNTSHTAEFPGIVVDNSGKMELFCNPVSGGSDQYLGLFCWFSLEKTN